MYRVMMESPKKHCVLRKTKFHSVLSSPADQTEVITTALSKMVAIDMLPIFFSENRIFNGFIDIAVPRFNVPGRHTIGSNIQRMYLDVKPMLEEKLDATSYTALITNAWSSRSTKSFVTVTVHGIDSEWKWFTFTLETIEFADRHTAVTSREHRENILLRCNLSNKIVGIVHDNASNITCAVRTSKSVGESVPCVAHTLQCAIHRGLALEELKSVIEKVSSIVAHFKHSNVATTALINHQRSLKLLEHRLIQSCRARWNSTFYMLERILEQRQAVCAIDNETTSSCARSSLNMKISDSGWRDMEILGVLLKPFERLTTVMSSENEVTILMVRPLIHSMLENYMTLNTDDGPLSTTFKNVLSEELRNPFLIATSIDEHCNVHAVHLAIFLGTIISVTVSRKNLFSLLAFFKFYLCFKCVGIFVGSPFSNKYLY
ncbi:zinc finger BED domain-containing protein 1-like [Cephus cinctus]|uniref:Zinc finger BED domain-containing protein 1-like n=1 Tax=Cephus cinctus TaxID=211228 RepID=A0AAJ7BZ96_CEPCN|nr:zinc finger BED domain-containing protein 1-like [Cephus cinctus]